MTARLRSVPAADPDAGLSLPAWTYRDPEFFAAERALVLRAAWQVVCHVSDIAAPGNWHTLEFLGESIIVIRGDDSEIRAFTNVCRHRGARLVDGASGCVSKLVCPYHAWTYGRDGRLTALPGRSDYPGLRLEDHGLAPVALEIWQGFVFVRLENRGPSVATMMQDHLPEVQPHRFADVRPLGRVTLRPRACNWKIIADNYSDGLHIPVAHPGLKRLFGNSYGIEAGAHVDRMWGDIGPGSGSWSERAYRRLRPRADHLGDAAQDRWLYFKLWPNVAFDIYPDQVDFMQFLPISATETMIREISYALPDDRREMKAARYLNWRINRLVNAEDTALVTRVQAGMASASYTQGPLGESEVCLRAFAGKLREAIPAARSPTAPAPGWFRG
ncbi:aromatic ring-hydroxylating oxygenase subunit alpha [Sandarakinorhabdus sp. DWP1-3-1]|uniref:aromatic ring-hydroxylating oxygenase subunit alpha n=1 Tax=Sandarakinorhabdus sp. DWP1-3-1 TaxID=2804627 RepID=UPI003CEC1225